MAEQLSAESIGTIRCALDLKVNFLDTSASYARPWLGTKIYKAVPGKFAVDSTRPPPAGQGR
jgi:aryl-alcohol dehydrogenase-like predicted oxidoreductase